MFRRGLLGPDQAVPRVRAESVAAILHQTARSATQDSCARSHHREIQGLKGMTVHKRFKLPYQTRHPPVRMDTSYYG